MALIKSHKTACEHWDSPYAISDYALRNPQRSSLLSGADVSFSSFDPLLAGLCAPASLEAAPGTDDTSVYALPVTLRRHGVDASAAPTTEAVQRYFSRRRELHSPPYHLLVLGDTNYHRVPGIKIHVCTTALPAHSFYPLEGNAYVVSPELCFAQMATVLNRIELIDLGFRLCGQYVLIDGKIAFRRPVTDAAFLAKQLKRMKGLRGTLEALSVARHICDRAASPRETQLAALLSLPCAWGGYGLPRPSLNHRIEAPNPNALDSLHFLCDLYWPEQKVAIEYDSDAFHTGAKRIARDARRRSALALRDVDVVTVTNGQIKSIDEMDQVAKLVARKLGVPFRLSKNYNFRERQLQLRAQLFKR